MSFKYDILELRNGLFTVYKDYEYKKESVRIFTTKEDALKFIASQEAYEHSKHSKQS